MTYKEFRDTVLSLINQYTSNGVLIDNLYNDQSDYVLRIPYLYNLAATDISRNGKPYLNTIRIDELEPATDVTAPRGYIAFELPSDFVKIYNGAMIPSVGGGVARGPMFYMIGQRTAAIRGDALMPGVITYECQPKRMPLVPGEDIENMRLPGDDEQNHTAAFLVAAMLVTQDDAFVYANLKNEYEDRLTKMKRRMSAEIVNTQDVYDIAGVFSGGVY